MENLRDDFPIFDKKDIHYLDSSATTQRPRCVIDNLNEYYTTFNANAGRGSYELSMINTSIVENTRKKVKEFIGSRDNGEVVFTKNCTEAINLVAYSYGLSFLKPGDEILLCVSNHHANILPWQFVKKVTSCTIKYFYLDEYGQVDMEDFKYKVNKNTKIVALSSVVNTTGIIQPFEEIINYAHKYDALVLLDCAQSIQHFKHEVFKWDVDFMTFSGHKMYSSFGVGVLYAKKELLEKMPPFIYGGDMIEYVEEQYSTYAKVPTKFEGGTLDSAAIYSLSRAIDYINLIGFKKIEDIENKLLVELLFKLKTLDFVETYYTENVDRVPVVAFNVKGVHSHDTAFILDKYKVSVRSGQHCTAPLHQFMKINSTCRASLNVYNTSSDIDALIEGLEKVKEVFKL
ncbi:SufS family cysteine desulfurase [Sneathia sp. DSM 16631]|uniref:SufS family cysteine desulfurase n=1 Tax=Sneathia TaxID=168808 RepID=UPI001867CF02|nr:MULTISPECIES: SufS family cysteine desulfurase [Sneathia]MBE3031496.1 SufS family cysteine desulfurase [Sneathia sp. DSM 16631]MDK9582396.1 SufS family cysteine desulfurase [Sneathia vaginalis]